MRLIAPCLCGPQRRFTTDAVSVADASRRADPTGTVKLQRLFQQQMDVRWRNLRNMASAATSKRFGGASAETVAHAVATGDDPVRAFQSWIDEAMRQVVLGVLPMSWMAPFISRAAAMAGERASALTAGDALRPAVSRVRTLQTMAVTELQGICEAVSQQCVRALASGMLSRQTPNQIARAMASVIDTVGKTRSQQLASFITVRAFAASTLDHLRAAGVSHVGILAERVRKSGPGLLTRDAAKKKAKKKKWAEPSDLVEVLTAGDDDVCPTCEDIADEGPYTLDDAEGLIPAHPNCVLPGMAVEGNVLAALKSSYSGPALEIETRSGRRLSVTGQHPILTSLGFVAAKDLREGMKLICKGTDVRWSFTSLVDANNNNGPILIEQIYDTLRAQGLCSVSPSGDDLHGDARHIDGDVDIVAVDWRLLCNVHSQSEKGRSKLVLPSAYARLVELVQFTTVNQFFARSLATTRSIPSTRALVLNQFARLLQDTPLQVLSLGSSAHTNIKFPKMLDQYVAFYSTLVRDLFERDAGLVLLDQSGKLSTLEDYLRSTGISNDAFQYIVHNASSYLQFLDDLVSRQPGLVEFDDVISLRSFHYNGPVYDLQTTTGSMVAQGIFESNCRCAFVPSADARYAHDAGPDDEARGPDGKWITGGGKSDKFVVAYHGTLMSAAKSIAKKGFVLKDYNKNSRFEDAGQYYKGERGHAIFVTNNKQTAILYAKSRADVGLPKAIGIVELHIPKNEWKKFKTDTLGNKDNTDKKAKNAYTTKIIPPEWVHKVSGYPDWYKLGGPLGNPVKIKDAEFVTMYLVTDLASHVVHDAGPDDEDRDDHGRWTSGGDSSFAKASKERRRLSNDPEGKEEVEDKYGLKHLKVNLAMDKMDEVYADTAKQTRDKELTSDEQKTVHAYQTKKALSEKLNAKLRAGGELDDKQTSVVKILDNVLKNSSLKEDHTLYRGLTGRAGRDLVSGLKPGDKLRDAGFMSTSLDEDTARGFSQGSKDQADLHVMRILADKGQQALLTGDRGGASVSDQEYETILPRNTSLEFNGKSTKGDITYYDFKIASKKLTKDYDPDQPRDDHGMWAGGFAGGPPLKTWQPPQSNEEWKSVAGQDHTIGEPPVPQPKTSSYTYTDKQTGQPVTRTSTSRVSSGVIMREKDGRTWIIKPTNGYGGYRYTFPKGGVEEGLHPQANAIKEAFEETGLKARITGFAGDYAGDTGVTRMYHAVRETGHPKDKGWETEKVRLAHPAELPLLLNRSRDKKIAGQHINPAMLTKDDYDPDEPRDDHGMWTSGGGAAGFANTLKEGGVQHAVEHDPVTNLHSVKVPKNDDLPSLEAIAKSHEDFSHKVKGLHSNHYFFKGKDDVGHGDKSAKYPDHVIKFKQLLNENGVEHTHNDAPSMGGHDFHVETHNKDYALGLAKDHGIPVHQTTQTASGAVITLPEKAPSKSGEVLSGHGGEAPIDMQDLTKVSGKKGSNEGGVYKDEKSLYPKSQYYIKQPATPDHVQNELLTARLYQLAGVKTLNYVPVKGGNHVATEMEDLAKNNVSQLSSVERMQAQHDFAVHAWLANWDAAGMGGDNVGVRKNGDVVTLDTGGGLKYRAQGEPKGIAFGNTVTEVDTLRDSAKNHDAAKLYGTMSNGELIASMKRVVDIPNSKIANTINAAMPMAPYDERTALVDKMIARKNDLASQMQKLTSAWAQHQSTAQTIVSAPKTSTTPSVVDHPAKAFLSQVKGTSAERVTWRKELAATPTPFTPGMKLVKSDLQHKIVASFWKQHGKLTGDKKTQIATKLAQYAKKYGMTNPLTAPTVAAPPAPKPVFGKASPTPPLAHADIVAPKPSSIATQAELEKAKKSVKLQMQYVPGAQGLESHPEAQKLLAAFNQKYEGKSLDTQSLHEKVADFKKLQSDMIPLMSEQQKQAAASAIVEKAAQSEKLAKDKAALEAKMNDPEVQKHYEVLKSIGAGQYTQGLDKLIAEHGLAITPEEGAYIRAYVGSHYGPVNDQLRKGVLTMAQHKYANALNDALAKMPKYVGNVERGAHLTPEAFKKYQQAVGGVAVEHQFTSAGVKHKLWGDHVFHIKSKSAADIRSFNSGEGGGEVVFRAGSKFHVTKVDTPSKQIWMEEL